MFSVAIISYRPAQLYSGTCQLTSHRGRIADGLEKAGDQIIARIAILNGGDTIIGHLPGGLTY